MRWERSCLKAAWEPISGNFSMMFTFFPSTIVHVKHQTEIGYTHLKSRRKLNLRFKNLVFTRAHGISSTILELRRVSFITLPKNAVNP